LFRWRAVAAVRLDFRRWANENLICFTTPIDFRQLKAFANGTRTHLSLNKDAPISRAAENAGRIICRPILGGLHHQYGRM
jgi:hypothetical protein